MRTFAVADAHGNLDLVTGLLQQVGALDENFERVPGIRTVQLGDLCNCVIESVVDDDRCLDHVEQFFDVYLVGNHEHPYFGGPRFAGFWDDLVLGQRLRSLKAKGFLGAALAVDGVLLSHAGLAKGTRWRKAETAAADIQRGWRFDPTGIVFSAIGSSRGGRHQAGGLLWSDWSEEKNQAIKQLCGHTVGAEVRRVDYPNGNWACCIDLGGGKFGGRIAGAWVEDGEIEVVIHQPSAVAA